MHCFHKGPYSYSYVCTVSEDGYIDTRDELTNQEWPGGGGGRINNYKMLLQYCTPHFKRFHPIWRIDSAHDRKSLLVPMCAKYIFAMECMAGFQQGALGDKKDHTRKMCSEIRAYLDPLISGPPLQPSYYANLWSVYTGKVGPGGRRGHIILA